MKINISPNFVIPGFYGKDSLVFESEKVTLLEVLEELSGISKGRIRFLKHGNYISENDFWIKINGNYIDGVKKDLERELHDGDTIAILLVTLGGG